MKIRIIAIFSIFLVLFITTSYAQTGLKLSGKISGSDGKPLDGASVYLLRAADSVLVKTALADEAGRYSFSDLKAGAYKLNITMVGQGAYKSGVIELKQDVVMPAVVLQSTGTELNAVSVTAQKPMVQRLIDRTVMNVDAMLTAAGSTALELLEKAPGVLVDQNGKISMQGKNNVAIFVDGKPTYLSGPDLENYLKSMPSSTVDQIELMTNPPAKYDAAGNGGVINIRTKRTKVKGFNGGLNLGYNQGKYTRSNNSANFNYRNNRFNMAGNFGFNVANGYNDLDINRYFQTAVPVSFMQNSFIRRTGQSYSARISMDYYASDKTTFGIGFTGLANPSRENTLNSSQFLSNGNRLDSTIIAHNDQHRGFRNGGVNLNYRHQYDKSGRELTADLDYLDYTTGSDQSFLNESFLPNGALKFSDKLTGNLPAGIRIYSAKADYVHPLRAGARLEGGLKTSYTETDNIADYFYTIGTVTKPDYDKTNHFIYNETINAAYLNASKDFKRISVQAGLRYEYTVSDGHQLGNAQKRDSSFRRNYGGLFPTFYLQYKLDSTGTQQIGFNYGRRIDRPYYQSLNPFISPLDKFTYYTGNPFLRPSFTNNFELSHTYKTITTALSYSKTRDDVNETIEIVNGIYYSRPGNLGSIQNMNISVSASHDVTKWLNVNLYATAINIHTVSDFYTGRLDTRGTFYYVQPIFQAKLKKDWSIQLDGFYQSKLTNAQFLLAERYKINAGFSKKLSASTSLKLVVNDIFRNYVNNGQITNLANTRADFRNLSDTRNIGIAFAYRFGKAIVDQRKHNASGAESEQNRVKN